MKETRKRTLYECSNARVKGSRIYCRKGHLITNRTDDGSLAIGQLARGRPLAYGICQDCPDFDFIGLPLLPQERGWLKKMEVSGNE